METAEALIMTPKLTRKKTVRRWKTPKSKPGSDILDQVWKYNLLEELARAASGMNFGQLARGDADEAKKKLRRLFRMSRIHTLGAQENPNSDIGDLRRLKVIPVRVYGTFSQVLLDTGAVPSILSSRLAT